MKQSGSRPLWALLSFCLLSAGALILCYPPFDLGWLAWFAFLPLLAAFEGLPLKGRFGLGVLTGLLFFAGSIHWLRVVTVPGYVLLVLLLAPAFGIWAILSRPPGRGAEEVLLLTVPAAWVICEFLRSHLFSGFGWNLLAHTQWRWPRVLQIADLTGAPGVSFLVVLVNTALHLFLRAPGRRTALRVLLPAGLILAGALAYGSVRLAVFDRMLSDGQRPSYRVAVVQGNIPQDQKWDDSFREKIWRVYERVSRRAAEGRPALVVWPETAVPYYLDRQEVRSRLARLARETGTSLLVGAPAREWKGEFRRPYNVAALFDARGEMLTRHKKLHLVPFGEYIPFPALFGWLSNVYPIGEFAAGDRFTVFASPETRERFPEGQFLPDEVSPKEAFCDVPPFSVLICFEDLFPELAARFVRQGARWLLVITNDAWFLRTAASVQHLQASVLRALENRVWVARATNTGWSGFIDPAGRVLPAPHRIPRWTEGWARAQLRIVPARSLYTRLGDWLVWLSFAWIGFAFFPTRRRL